VRKPGQDGWRDRQGPWPMKNGQSRLRAGAE
jgi:hypothetical protein